MPELLIELFSEEIPARMQARGADDFKRLVGDKLALARLTFKHAEAHVTPRRLTLAFMDVPARQPDLDEERKGPRVGSPESAIQGFLKSAGLTSLDQCEKRVVGNAEFWIAKRKVAGRKAVEVLPEIVAAATRELPWPKSQRWGKTSFRYVRPLHGVLALFDGKPLKGFLDLGGAKLAFGDVTAGHRFLAPKPIAVKNFAAYKKKLRAAFVVLDREERKAIIARDAAKLAAQEKLAIKDDPALLEEVCGLVEWPVVLLGSIDKQFMDVPREVLTTTMRAHQKYFALETKDGKLASRFVLVSNIKTGDGGRAIVAGNERVLRARLADAKFFWDQDRRVRLEARVPKLAARVFYAGLGTLEDKVVRLEKLAVELAPFIPGADGAEVLRAALLCKADLVSGMVGEFPELQGIMGRYYALHDREPHAVADAIAEHYAPLGPNDRCPTAPVSIAVALADKIDTLVGFWSIGEKPTGSKDPYALRRAALGAIRLIVENKLRVPLYEIFNIAHLLHGEKQAGNASVVFDADDLMAFFADRLKVHLREQGARHDLVTAVIALGDEDDLVRLLSRVEALTKFLKSDDGANLLTAYKRASNILRIEEKRDGRTYEGPAETALLSVSEERTLYDGLGRAMASIEGHVRREHFAAAMEDLARLRPTVDAFFDKVTVNCDDSGLRENRLRLLSGIRAALASVADFSKIEG
jgi:glycyl-tRNA synthetase beta chain